MNLQFSETPIEGLVVIESPIYRDDRGWFMETYNELAYAASGIPSHFVQDNLSCSSKNVLRGLHFQNPPYAQGKLVRVLAGAVLDVAVDLRSSSPTYGQHYKVELSAANRKSFWIPAGFAHGFLSMEDNTLFQYKCSNYYHPESEQTLRWDDPQLDIFWGVQDPVVSSKDKDGQSFSGYKSLF